MSPPPGCVDPVEVGAALDEIGGIDLTEVVRVEITPRMVEYAWRNLEGRRAYRGVATSSIEIAQQAELWPIGRIAESLGILGFVAIMQATVRDLRNQGGRVLDRVLAGERVTITRDDWGIAHISGPRDADAIFGMMVAQAEDDFNRVETNYITAMGRAAEHQGAIAILPTLEL